MVLPLLPFLFIGKAPGQRLKSVLQKVKNNMIKRDDIKEREWKVAKERIMKNAHRG